MGALFVMPPLRMAWAALGENEDGGREWIEAVLRDLAGEAEGGMRTRKVRWGFAKRIMLIDAKGGLLGLRERMKLVDQQWEVREVE